MSAARTLRNAVATAVALLVTLALSAWAVPLQAPATGAEGAIKPPFEPRKVHHVSPVYPPEAKADKVQGVFEVDVVIGKDGTILDARVAASAATLERLRELASRRGTPAALEGDARLAESAVTAVKQWRYEPIVVGGVPVEARMTVTVNFRLG